VFVRGVVRGGRSDESGAGACFEEKSLNQGDWLCL
jgi:hypothetical protein